MTHTSMSQFHTGWGTFFGGVRLLWIVMIFQKDKDDKDDISTKFILRGTKMTQVNGSEMESKDAPHVSHGVRGRSRLVKVIFYFISFLVICSKYKIYTIKGVSKVSILGSRM